MGMVTDPRKPYNQLHAFLDIVAIAVLATLCGADALDEIFIRRPPVFAGLRLSVGQGRSEAATRLACSLHFQLY